MKYIFKILILLFCQNSFGQIKEVKINELIKFEGVQYIGGITFYKDKTERILFAVQNGKIKWSKNIIESCSGNKKYKIVGIGFYGVTGIIKVYYGKKVLALLILKLKR